MALIYGTSGSDNITTIDNSNTIFGSNGADTIDATTSARDTLYFDFSNQSAGLSSPPGANSYLLTSTSFSDAMGFIATSFTGIEAFRINLSATVHDITFDASNWTVANPSYSYLNSWFFGSGDDTVFGSIYDEQIDVNGGSNFVDAGGGNDTVAVDVTSGGGRVTISGNASSLTVVQDGQVALLARNTETLRVGNNNDVTGQVLDASALSGVSTLLFDGQGDDVLIGSRGQDVFATGETSFGNDILTGNGGADLFDFIVTANTLDGTIITDFDSDDVIDFNFNTLDVGASTTVTTFIGMNAFSGTVGEYRYDFDNGETIVQIDGDGDGMSDGTLRITNGTFHLAEETNDNGPRTLVISSQAMTVNGTAGDDEETGGAGDDFLYGLAGNDVLQGLGGNDTIDGGEGIDTASYRNANDAVYVSLLFAGTPWNTSGDGVDTLISIENLEGSRFEDVLQGDVGSNDLFGYNGDDALLGEAGDDRLYGENGDDVLIGGDGDDRIDGGEGIDTADYYSATERVVVNLGKQDRGQETRGAGRDLLVDIENLSGSVYGDNLRGDGDDNTLSGSDGNDRLAGAAGNDLLIGGEGGDRVIGGAGDDNLRGNSGDDLLRGGEGADRAAGGTGDDLYIVDDAFDVIVEREDQGIDTVISAIDYVLDDNVENLRLRTGRLDGTGNDLDNEIDGGVRGNNTLLGLGGSDTIHGGLGRDQIDGGAGQDRIYGDQDPDTLTGGADADRFIFDDGHLGSSVDATDTITDFSHAEGDRISLRSLDADSTTGGDQDFVFLGQDGFTGTAGELRFDFEGGNTVVQMDTDGDGMADLYLMLLGEHALVQGDFAL